jgi:hypothetical protein
MVPGMSDFTVSLSKNISLPNSANQMINKKYELGKCTIVEMTDTKILCNTTSIYSENFAALQLSKHISPSPSLTANLDVTVNAMKALRLCGASITPGPCEQTREWASTPTALEVFPKAAQQGDAVNVVLGGDIGNTIGTCGKDGGGADANCDAVTSDEATCIATTASAGGLPCVWTASYLPMNSGNHVDGWGTTHSKTLAAEVFFGKRDNTNL